MATAGTGGLRRGLPRVPGGGPWPPDHGSPDRSGAAVTAAEAGVGISVEVRPALAAPFAEGVAIRRGLPRTPGGEAWPAAGFAPVGPNEAHDAAPARHAESDAAAIAAADLPEPVAASMHVTHTVPVAVVEAAHVRQRPRVSVLVRTITTCAGAVVVLAILVLVARWLVTLGAMQDFAATYPGIYPLPAGAPVGIPTWLGWQHFFNLFLMVLIIRSGLQVRRQRRPPATWSPRWNRSRKISVTLWFHQSLDILWLLNGVVYVVLLFATGQWMRIVPTSWAVFPNAFTAGLDYLSLRWPTEDGWANYNSLQQLAYFGVVFLLAPLAAISGVRMSGLWPASKRLAKAYPVEWARTVHFPVMICFVLFLIVHVTLVFATGALRNLNHMYGGSDAANWIGFGIFAVSSVAIVAALMAARPVFLAPIARLFGTVSGR